MSASCQWSLIPLSHCMEIVSHNLGLVGASQVDVARYKHLADVSNISFEVVTTVMEKWVASLVCIANDATVDSFSRTLYPFL